MSKDIRSILEDIGYTNIKDLGKEYRMSAIYRDGDNETALRVKKDTGYFTDFKESISGPIEDLVKITLKLKDVSEAKSWLSGKIDLTKTSSAPKSKIKEQRIFPEGHLDTLVKDHSYWLGRGVSDSTIKSFNGGVVLSGKMKDRYVFPIKNYKKQIVGFSGRDILPTKQNSSRPKWKHLGDKSSWRFPFEFNYNIIQEKKSVIVIESIGDMLSLWDAGIKNTLVSFGLDLSVPCINTLLRVDPNKIHICLNNDSESSGAGNTAAKKLKAKLLKYFDPHQVKINELTEYNDFGEMPTNKVKEFFHELKSI
tara:strand:- start:12605 stop:13531 length:927 start_codon:yes stop_codon:yes gene_type:complete